MTAISHWHPHAERFPLMDGEKRVSFEEDIGTNGQRESVKYRMKDGARQGLDGRNRVKACESLGIECRYEKVFIDDDQAEGYIDSLNLHRRHLTPEQESYARGKEYNASKKPTAGRPKKGAPVKGADNSPTVGELSKDKDSPKSTAEKLAEKHGVSPTTIESDAKFAAAVDAIAEQAPETKAEILAGKSGLTRQEVVELAAPPAAEPPPADDLPRDGWGIPIQDHARDAFEAQPLFDELLSLLRQADKLYSKIAETPGGAYLIRPGISINSRERWKHAGIKTALLNVEDCRPTYTICPRAYHSAAFPESNHVHDDNCNLCHGLNWSRELGKKEIPAEVIAKAKEAFNV